MHPYSRWILLLAALAPFLLAYIIVREHELSWPRGQATSVLAIFIAGFCLYWGFITGRASRRARSRCRYGWFVILLGAILMFVGLVHAHQRDRGQTQAARRDVTGSFPSLDTRRPDRNLALELVRVTEAAALAAARLVGHGRQGSAADQAAVDAMHVMLGSVRMDGVVVIGEGEKDEAPMLYNGEHIGDGSPPEVDIAVDPLEGTTLAARRRAATRWRASRSPSAGRCSTPGRACTWRSSPGRRTSPTCSTSTGRSRRRSSWSPSARGRAVRDVVVVVLDRPRHEEGIAAIREAGARVRLIPTATSSAALLAVSDNSPVDLLWGIGGTPEGVSRRVRDQVHRRRAARPPVAARRRASASAADRRRLRRRARADRPTSSSAATTPSSPPRASPTATSSRACATSAPARRPPSRS